TNFHFGEAHLTAKIALDIAEGTTKGILSKSCLQKVEASNQRVGRIVEKGDIVYGINTSFGPLCTTVIPQEDTRPLQFNIPQSHAVGVGAAIWTQLDKFMLIL